MIFQRPYTLQTSIDLVPSCFKSPLHIRVESLRLFKYHIGFHYLGSIVWSILVMTNFLDELNLATAPTRLKVFDCFNSSKVMCENNFLKIVDQTQNLISTAMPVDIFFI